MSKRPICENCRHAFVVDAEKDQFTCKRFPPVPLLVPTTNALGEHGLGVQTVSPPVNGADHCGEFAPGAPDS